MKISFAALAATVAANSQHPEVQGWNIFGSSEAVQDKALKQREDTEWYAAGIKGYYVGFYKSFYKMELPEANKKCLDSETIDNVITFQNVLGDPLSLFTDALDIQKDVNYFAQMAEIMEDMTNCKFEQPAIDILSLCTKDSTACSLTTLTQNMSKDMFVLIGKLTSLAEILQDFPSKNKDDFFEEMRELGSTGGTWGRVIFNFHHPGEETTHHYHHSSDYDY